MRLHNPKVINPCVLISGSSDSNKTINMVGVTISNDGTTHRNVNYESWHIKLKAQSYCPAPTESESPVNAAASEDANTPFPTPLKCHTCVVSVTPSIGHTSETQMEGWKNELHHLSTTFSQSPLTCRLGLTLDINQFLMKLKGLHTDHANNQKKTYRLWQEWKNHVICVTYSFEKIEKMKADSPNDLINILFQVTSSVIERVGGCDKWDILDAKE